MLGIKNSCCLGLMEYLIGAFSLGNESHEVSVSGNACVVLDLHSNEVKNSQLSSVQYCVNLEINVKLC